jgi:hypothetical protein
MKRHTEPGTSNIASPNTSSNTPRSPLAPPPRFNPTSATALKAPLVNCSSLPYRSKISVYCLTSAFLGSRRIWIRSSFDNGCRVDRIGSRPRNSGIKPYCCKSGDVRPFRGVGSWSTVSGLAGLGSGAPNPIDYFVSLSSKVEGRTYSLAKPALDNTLQSDECSG